MWSVRSLWTATAAVVWASLTLNTVAQAKYTDVFYSALNPCPAACNGRLDNWTVYTSVDRLDICDQPLLLDFAIYNPLEDPTTSVKLRTCTAGDANDTENALVSPGNSSTQVAYTRRSASPSDLTKRNSSVCIFAKETKVTLNLAVSSGQSSSGTKGLSVALEKVQSYLGDPSNCDTKIIFGYARCATSVVNARCTSFYLRRRIHVVIFEHLRVRYPLHILQDSMPLKQ
jgi:chitinase